MPKSLAKSFRAILEPDGTNLKWTIIHVPLEYRAPGDPNRADAKELMKTTKGLKDDPAE